MSVAADRLLTAKEFWHSPANGKFTALVRGEVVELMPPGGLHGIVALALGSLLGDWAKVAGGYAGVESGFLLARDPDTVRGPDVFYVRADRMPAGGIPEAFWQQPPDLAVEIVSPSETAAEVREKVRDFLQAGTPLVWVVYPRTREVVVHTPDGLARTLGSGDALDGAAVLPGFSCRVAELFESR